MEQMERGEDLGRREHHGEDAMRGNEPLRTAKNVTAWKPSRCFALLEKREFELNDFDLRLQRSQVTLAEDHRLTQPVLFLHDAFPLIVEQPLGTEIPRAGETGEQDLSRQFRLLLLHTDFALLKHAPRVVQAFGTGYERLHL